MEYPATVAKFNIPILQVICVAYERPTPLRILCDCFEVQTSRDWRLHIVHDGKPTFDFVESDNRIKFEYTPYRTGCYGHINRGMMLDKLICNDEDYILITNDDNYYVPKFVEMMLKVCEHPNVGIVMCDTLHSHAGYCYHSSSLKEGGIDMGAFIVRSDIAKHVGFRWTHFSADGKYAEECGKYAASIGADIMKINRALFIHN